MPDERPIEKLRMDGWAGYTCYFCGKNIGRLPYVIVQPFLLLSDGTEYTGNHDYSVWAHPSCAKKNGLVNPGDSINVRR